MFYRTWTVLRVTALWRDGTSGTASPAVLGSGVGARALSLLCSPATCYGACAITAPSSPRSVNYQWNRYIGMREYFGLFIYTGLLYWCVYCVVLGQLCVLQVCVAVENPVQSLPPYCGAGFVQERILVWIPPPQVTVQVPHDPHDAQNPST